MRRGRLAAAACLAGLVAGCGSSAKAPTKPTGPSGSATSPISHGPAMAKTGTAGQVGPASGKFDATNSAILYNIRVALVRFFISKGFSGVTASCTGINTTTASCNVAGTNKAEQSSSAVLTLSVDQTNGVLRITHVTS
jgi:hypothetical protein